MANTDPGGPEPKGFGGWLILPLLSLFLSVGYLLITVVVLLRTPTPQSLALAAVDACLCSYAGYCLLRFLERRREVPLLMTVFYGITAARVIVFWIAYAGGYEWATAHLMKFYPLSFVVPLSSSLAWLAYFQTSVRVKNTFVETAPPPTVRAGIGGAMLFPLGWLVFITAMAGSAMAFGHLPDKTQYAIQHHHWAAIALNVAKIALTALSVVCIVLIARKKRPARWLTITDFVLWAVIAAVSVPVQAAPWRTMAPIIVLSVGFTVYFLASKRVKNTFVR